ncbi:natural resistance-associated macrophage protein-domain-containing protein [Naematelia encephala]|uniref:Natural resistance-associated macrophage protein-domain-containing protein n=1 Tax=Naematelia encephala TaxID=71784 RepID=A0A1Y2B401_9TREE|nr:natural resistance-associated macrophage protein-domain-containing protein [Naematelia encephala]
MLSLKRARELIVRHLYFVGPGLVSSVAYIDPGNWATDLEAGANYGYKLLFIVLLAGIAAVVLQLLSVRLGATTSLSLPSQTRLIFVRLQQKYPKYRIPLQCALYTLYALAEIAIIGTDLAELLGSAIALNLLFPRLPLYAGVLITAADVLIILVFFRSSTGRQGMLFFEIVIVSLVLAVFVSFMILLHLVKPDWRQVFLGLVPSKTLVQPGALYVGVGIIGATVMPHALFLGSSLSSVDRLNMIPVPPSGTSNPKRSFKLPAVNPWSRLRRRRTSTRDNEIESTDIELRDIQIISSPLDLPSSSLGPSSSFGRSQSDLETKYEADVRSFDRIAWLDIHLLHSTIDTALSLLGFALTINAAILTLAGAAFYYNRDADSSDASLQGAHALIKSFLGNGAALIFALALLCAGQSASITATLAGQVVSEGFINWKTSPFARRAVTRLIGVIPAAIVAAAVGNKGLNTMLVASQVLLSIVLPTVIFPLVYLCSREDLMTAYGPEIVEAEAQVPLPSISTSDETRLEQLTERRKKSYKSPVWVTVLGYALFGIVVLANGYVIVELALGA